MAAANTDKFKKAKRRFSTTVGVGGFTASATTLPLSSTSGLDTDTAITLVIEPGSINEEVITGVVSGTNIINCVRGKEGTTDTTHTAGSAVSMYFTETHWDDLINGILVAHNQDGSQATDSITTTSITNDAVTTAKINNSAVTTAKIANANVTGAKIDFASTGAGGVWWEELGRTTLTSAGDTITISSFTPKKYLQLHIFCIATGGTIAASISCNSDTGNNYARRSSVNGAADTTDVSQAGAGGGANISGVAAAENIQIVSNVINIATSEKLFISSASGSNTAGAGNAPTRRETVLKWANTSSQISTLTLTNTGTGDFAIGSEMVILGHN